jgi:phospholipid/cholesterol/gamma-HCH transport system substrate-binding protein
MITGAFVLLLSLATLGFVFWMGKNGLSQKTYDHYRVYLDESVSGLNVESPVKYKGVEVGSVSHIAIDKQDPDRIAVDLQIEKGIPIRANHVAFLGSQGITGLKYIEIIKEGNATAPLLKPGPEGYAVIRSSKSLLGKLEDSAMSISDKIDLTLTRINRTLSDQNIQNFSNILAHTETATRYLAERRATVDQLLTRIETILSDENLRHLSGTLRHADGSMAQVDALLQKHGDKTMQALADTLLKAQDTLRKVDALLASGAFDLQKISQPTLDRLDDVLLETKKTLQTAEALLEAIKQSPSDILFKTKAVKYGPGEAP